MEGNTLQELEQKLMGLTPEVVIQAMGKKPDVSMGKVKLMFVYDRFLSKEYSDDKDILYIHFTENKVVEVSKNVTRLS